MTLMVNRRAAEDLLTEGLVELTRRLRERLLAPESVRQALENFEEFERRWLADAGRLIDDAERELSQRVRALAVVESDPA